MSTRIKICGITNVDDALAAVVAGADALGFVFYDKSPRCVTTAKVREIVSELPPFVTTVGLFVNAPPGEIRQTMTESGVQVIQLHGDEMPEECRIESYPVVKALRVKDVASLAGADAFPVSALLLDAWSDKEYGGSGKSFDWQLAKNLTADKPLILAGGLKPENVAEAIRQVRPYAVDVSSGVESAPGRKDHEKIKQFIKQVRNP
ncbi:MAG: phosphoribosylanthranilate isomerase [Desulfuromonas sp.]|nr:MAG: phosphoribosylanthranilate isomerase [Desulfuromonas sp.]